MAPWLLSILVLALLFLGAFVPRFSLALAALPAALLVAALGGVSTDELLGFFPVDFVVLIVGITALFAVIQLTGTTDWLLSRALRPIGNRVALIPLLLFAVGALLTAIGTFPAAVVAIMAPLTLGIAAKRGLPPLLLCVALLNGVMCGLFSPIAVFGATTPRLMAKAGIDAPAHTSLSLFLGVLGTGLVLCLAAMLVGRRSIRDARDATPTGYAEAAVGDGPTGSTTPPPHGAADRLMEQTTGVTGQTVTVQAAPDSPSHAADAISQTPGPGPLAVWGSVVALIVLVIGGAVFQVNLGLLGLTLALALQLVLRVEPSAVIRSLPWEIILMIAGVLTYVGLMEHLGAFEHITKALSGATGSPLLSLLVVCLIVGLTSFFASSIAVIATGVPMVAPLMHAGLSPAGALTAVALSAVLVDVNPLGITGGLLLGAAAPEHRARLFRQLMTYGLSAIVAGPVLAWGVFGWAL
ncbi:SLC13 family permease [Streptomyces sp. NBC_00498]|uniref:SLC13 family permease n=1 Tax=Streptomyces sp. NBC_00498 TaxID=2975760 RepID=UPI002E19AA41